MSLVKKLFLVALVFPAAVTLAATPPKEAPPMEPPYTNDTEFDPLQGEDPAASNSVIPTSPPVQAPSSAQSLEPAPNGGLKPKPYSQRPKAGSQSPPTTPHAAAPQSPHAAAPQSPPAADRTALESGEPDDATAASNPAAGAKDKSGVRHIHHPGAKQGLVRIEQDGTYVYKVKLHGTTHTGTVRFGKMEAPDIVSADGSTTFKKMYNTESLSLVSFDYDWQFFTGFGKLAAEVGIGLSTATGNGHFLKNTQTAPEVYTFVVLPLNAGVTYRFQYARNQWVAPYISGGGSYYAIAEIRDDNKRNFTGTPAAYGAGGLMFNIVALNKEVGFTLDNEYGVGGLWATTEFRYQKAFSQDLDFSGSTLSLGISAEF